MSWNLAFFQWHHSPGHSVNGKWKWISRQWQLPITPAYAFTDYHACPGSDDQILCGRHRLAINTYVVLSRSPDDIRILRDFDQRLFTRHPNDLRKEDIWPRRQSGMFSRSDRSVFDADEGVVRWNGRVEG